MLPQINIWGISLLYKNKWNEKPVRTLYIVYGFTKYTSSSDINETSNPNSVAMSDNQISDRRFQFFNVDEFPKSLFGNSDNDVIDNKNIYNKNIEAFSYKKSYIKTYYTEKLHDEV